MTEAIKGAATAAFESPDAATGAPATAAAAATAALAKLSLSEAKATPAAPASTSSSASAAEPAAVPVPTEGQASFTTAASGSGSPQPWSPRGESGARPLSDFLAPEHVAPGYAPPRNDLPRARPSAPDVHFHTTSTSPSTTAEGGVGVGSGAGAGAGAGADVDQPWLRRARQRSSSMESRHTLDWPFAARIVSARYLTQGGRQAERRWVG